MAQLLKRGRKVPPATRSADLASFIECWDLLGEFADALPVEARRFAGGSDPGGGATFPTQLKVLQSDEQQVRRCLYSSAACPACCR